MQANSVENIFLFNYHRFRGIVNTSQQSSEILLLLYCVIYKREAFPS